MNVNAALPPTAYRSCDARAHVIGLQFFSGKSNGMQSKAARGAGDDAKIWEDETVREKRALIPTAQSCSSYDNRKNVHPYWHLIDIIIFMGVAPQTRESQNTINIYIYTYKT
jgi:hypothetical protein